MASENNETCIQKLACGRSKEPMPRVGGFPKFELKQKQAYHRSHGRIRNIAQFTETTTLQNHASYRSQNHILTVTKNRHCHDTITQA